MIHRVCVASATFCSRLETKAIGDASRAQYSETTARIAESTLSPATSVRTHKEVLRPILDEKGFSVHDWAKHAKVDFHTANNYLAGKTRPHPNTLKKLADALGLEVAKLPK
jgi:hypothetical protein